MTTFSLNLPKEIEDTIATIPQETLNAQVQEFLTHLAIAEEARNKSNRRHPLLDKVRNKIQTEGEVSREKAFEKLDNALEGISADLCKNG